MTRAATTMAWPVLMGVVPALSGCAGARPGAVRTLAAAAQVRAPRMAAKAMDLGVWYVRFMDDELDNLVGCLRGVAR